jgi:ribulose 1,5-bisphosphate carboxylase large subunit-like protein
VVRLEGASAWLQRGKDEIVVEAAGYQLSVNSSLVAGWRGGTVLRDMRVAAGEFTVTGKRNQHAVADRFRRVGNSVRALGDTVTLNGGGKVTIERQPLAIRLEST